MPITGVEGFGESRPLKGDRIDRNIALEFLCASTSPSNFALSPSQVEWNYKVKELNGLIASLKFIFEIIFQNEIF